MSFPDPTLTESRESTKLKRRDWILLPLISLLTLCILSAAVELTARRLFPAPHITALSCLILNDPSTGVRAIPNSTCVDQLYESKPVDYVYNNCGHRAGMPCQPKQPGTFRIVLVGSSFAEGLFVSREKTFAALLPAELSRDTGRRIELYNEGMQWGTPRSVDRRFNEALAAKPDMILWAVTPFDVEYASLTLPSWSQVLPNGIGPAATGRQVTARKSLFRRVAAALTTRPLPTVLRDSWERILQDFSETRTSVLLQHFLYQSQSHYVKTFLRRGDGTEFLKTEPSERWQSDLKEFAGYDADVQAKARAAGIPLVVVILPNRVQAAMISMGQWPDGFDPYKFGNDVRSILENNGGTYIDILHHFRNIPNPERNYYALDGHIDPNGHAIVSGLLARELTGGAVPSLAAIPEQRNAAELKR
jgi:hypothetical protein